MERLTIPPRPGYAQKLEAIGLSFHAWDDYWQEGACYRFSAAEIDLLEEAADDLHQRCLEALAHVIAKGRLGELGIPPAFWPAITLSRLENDFSLYGRFDFAYDGQSPPKLLEYNADTPTSLLESAIAQWHWLEDCHPEADQFNSLHERLVERWRALPGNGAVHFASLAGNEEDWVCTTYLMDTLTQAGRTARHIDIEDIGWDVRRNTFVDLDEQPITQLFKLYPWEWAMREDFGRHIATAATRFIEPLWKAPLSSKGLLPILWELFPDHPNLLPAFFSANRLAAFARKPLFSREGANVELHADGRLLARGDGPYGQEGHIYQALHPLPEFAGRYPVLGVWLVDGKSCGLCIREDTSPITTNQSQFIPHYFTPNEA